MSADRFLPSTFGTFDRSAHRFPFGDDKLHHPAGAPSGGSDWAPGAAIASVGLGHYSPHKFRRPPSCSAPDMCSPLQLLLELRDFLHTHSLVSFPSLSSVGFFTVVHGTFLVVGFPLTAFPAFRHPVPYAPQK